MNAATELARIEQVIFLYPCCRLDLTSPWPAAALPSEADKWWWPERTGSLGNYSGVA
jgi:hypothetical protein